MNLAKLTNPNLFWPRIDNGIYCRLVTSSRHTVALTSVAKPVFTPPSPSICGLSYAEGAPLGGTKTFKLTVFPFGAGTATRVVFYDNGNNYIGHCPIRALGLALMRVTNSSSLDYTLNLVLRLGD